MCLYELCMFLLLIRRWGRKRQSNTERNVLGQSQNGPWVLSSGLLSECYLLLQQTLEDIWNREQIRVSNPEIQIWDIGVKNSQILCMSRTQLFTVLLKPQELCKLFMSFQIEDALKHLETVIWCRTAMKICTHIASDLNLNANFPIILI